MDCTAGTDNGCEGDGSAVFPRLGQESRHGGQGVRIFARRDSPIMGRVADRVHAMQSELPFSRRRALGACLIIAMGALALALFTVRLAAAAEPAMELPDYDVVARPLVATPVADRFASAVTRIGPEQLRDLQPLDFASALRRSPGVTVTRYNQVGAFGGSEGGAVFLRGIGASRPGGEIKTTVDGVPKLNGIFNHPLLDLLSLDSAAAIHIHHRAAPLEFGNTFGAVNILTPRVREPGTLTRATFAAGSFGTVVESVAHGGMTAGGTDYFFSQGYRRSDGARADAEGRLGSVFLRVGQNLGAHWNLSYRVTHSDNRTADPGPVGALPGPPNTKGETYATRDWLHLAALEWNCPQTAGAIRVYRNDGEGNWTRRQFSGNADSLNDWQLYGVRWRQTLRLWEGGELLAGADLDYDRGTSISVPNAPSPRVQFGPETTRLFSPYAGANHTFRAGEVNVTPSVGARLYQHDALGSAWSPQAGLVVAHGRTHYRAAFSRAVNYPGLEVRAVSTFNAALGSSWTRLDPEEAEQWEFAVRHGLGERGAVTVTLFRNEVSNRYVIVPPPPPPPRYTNLGAYRVNGAELSVEFAPTKTLKLFTGLTLLGARPAALPYVPDLTLNAGLNWRFAAHWHVSADATYVSGIHIASAGRSTTATNPRTVGAQFALNARLARRFTFGAGDRNRAEIFLAGENLTDRDYFYNPGYPLPGVNGVIGVRFER